MTIKNLREDRRPADLWFWSDWFSSFDVRACSLAAQGLWINMLGIMSRSEIKGALTINGKQIGSKILANALGKIEMEIIPLLKELEDMEVFSRLDNGTIINRRMLREGELSRKRAEAGRLGGSSKKHIESKGENKGEASLECEDDNDNDIDKKFGEFWAVYPREGRLAKKESRIKFGALMKRGEIQQFIKGFHGYMDYLKHRKLKDHFEQRPMYAKTFMNGRWQEFIEFKYEPGL